MRASFIRIAAAIIAFALMGCRDSADSPSLLAPLATPAAIKIPLPPGALVDLSAGSEHTCAKTYGGTLFCWGSNSNGQIGVPTTNTCGRYGYGLTPCVPHPSIVTGTVAGRGGHILQSFTTVDRFSAGAFHTCVVSSGAAWCWGSNMFGQIGNNSSDGANVPAPTPVVGGPFTGIAAGGGATCGISNTNLFCWGKLWYSGPTRYIPLLDSWNPGWSDNISVGASHACAMTNDAIWNCWGDNLQGEIGADPIVWQYFDGPLANPAFQGASNMAAGGGFTCLDQPNSTIQCLGNNSSGQLGDWNLTAQKSSTPVTVGGQPTPRSLNRVTTGHAHACALDQQNVAWCWGSDLFGQLGRGAGWSGGFVRDPVRVAGGLTFFKLAAGDNHTCGLTTGRTIFCWGDNYFSQLGLLNQAAPAANPQPVQVMF